MEKKLFSTIFAEKIGRIFGLHSVDNFVESRFFGLKTVDNYVDGADKYVNMQHLKRNIYA